MATTSSTMKVSWRSAGRSWMVPSIFSRLLPPQILSGTLATSSQKPAGGDTANWRHTPACITITSTLIVSLFFFFYWADLKFYLLHETVKYTKLTIISPCSGAMSGRVPCTNTSQKQLILLTRVLTKWFLVEPGIAYCLSKTKNTWGVLEMLVSAVASL